VPEAFDPLRILAGLWSHGVSYVLIGELGAAVRGAATDTDRVEICVPDDQDNLARLSLTLQQLGAQPRAGSTGSDHRAWFDTPFGRLGCLESDSDFVLLDATASDVKLDHGVVTRVASLDDLARSRRASADLPGAVRLATLADAAQAADPAIADALDPLDPDPPPRGRIDRMLRKLDGVDALLIDLSEGKLPSRRRKR